MRRALACAAIVLAGCLDYDAKARGDLASADLASADLASADLDMTLFDLAPGFASDLSGTPGCTPGGPDAGSGSFEYRSSVTAYATSDISQIHVPAGVTATDVGLAFVWSRADFVFSPIFNFVAASSSPASIHLTIGMNSGNTAGALLNVGSSPMPYYATIVFYPAMSCVIPKIVMAGGSGKVTVALPTFPVPTIDVAFFAQPTVDCEWPYEAPFHSIISDASPVTHTRVDSAVYEYVAKADEPVTFSAPTSCIMPGETYDVALVQLVP